MKVKKIVVFDEKDRQVIKDMCCLVDTVCGEMGGDCPNCPFRPVCDDVPNESSICLLLEKLFNEKQVIVE